MALIMIESCLLTQSQTHTHAQAYAHSSSSSCSPTLLSAGTEDGEGEATHMKILGAIIPPGQDFFHVEKLWMLVCYLIIFWYRSFVASPGAEDEESRTCIC